MRSRRTRTNRLHLAKTRLVWSDNIFFHFRFFLFYFTCIYIQPCNQCLIKGKLQCKKTSLFYFLSGDLIAKLWKFLRFFCWGDGKDKVGRSISDVVLNEIRPAIESQKASRDLRRTTCQSLRLFIARCPAARNVLRSPGKLCSIYLLRPSPSPLDQTPSYRPWTTRSGWNWFWRFNVVERPRSKAISPDSLASLLLLEIACFEVFTQFETDLVRVRFSLLHSFALSIWA